MNPSLDAFLSWLFRFVTSRGMRVVFLCLLGLTLVLCAGAYLTLRLVDIPDVGDIQRARRSQPSVLLASDGRRLATFRQVQQQWVSLDDMSPHIVQALVATEDHRFYDHAGIDYLRSLAAVFHTASGELQGGSTITQQLARNLFPDEIGRSRTLTRKLKEMMTAREIEKHYSKRAVLETYLNTVPFLYNVTGIEMAARTYYGKSAADLDVTESAMLVGMLKGTHYYNPVMNPDRALMRRNVVLSQMAKRGKLSAQEAAEASRQPLALHFARQMDTQDPAMGHFIVYTRKWLADWAERSHVNLYDDGLVIETTIDSQLQEAATRAVKEQSALLQQIADVEWAQRSLKILANSPDAYARLDKQVEPFRYFWNANPELVETFIRESAEYRKAVAKGDKGERAESPAAAMARLMSDERFMAALRAAKTRLEAGFVAIEPGSGEIKAWVGSRDFSRDQFDHVVQALRQPGSTFKPIVYGAALERGLSPDRMYRDLPVSIRSSDGVWRPTDMSGWTGREMSLRQGLIFSKNTITAQVMQDVGLPAIVDLAKAVGINQSRLDPVPSLALGTSSVTLMEMVSAYSTIAQMGEYRQPVFIRRVTDRNDVVIAEFGNGSGERALSQSSALELIDMMRGVVDEGTGRAMRTRFGVAGDIAGKTGTTQNNTDGWFILMHPNLVAGAWVGFNDARVTMRSEYWGQGGHNAILIVGDFFRDILKAKMIDGRARFPRPLRTPIYVVQDGGVQDWRDALDADNYAQIPVGSGMIVQRTRGRTLIGDERGIDAMSKEQTASRSQDDLTNALRAMGRDPVTGERVQSSGGPTTGRSAAGGE